jgi:hypothetical protein
MARITQGFPCPQCGAWTRVLETRKGTRKRECGNLHRFYTEETVLGLSNIKSKESEDGANLEMRDTSGEGLDAE